MFQKVILLSGKIGLELRKILQEQMDYIMKRKLPLEYCKVAIKAFNSSIV